MMGMMMILGIVYCFGVGVAYFIVTTLLKNPEVVASYNTLSTFQRGWVTFVITLLVFAWPVALFISVARFMFRKAKV